MAARFPTLESARARSPCPDGDGRGGGVAACSGRVSVCLVNRDGAEVLGGTIAALVAALGPECEVILVDDASSDQSVAIARAALPGARILLHDVRRGPAAARNAAIRAATRPLLLLLDNDVHLMPECVDRLAEALAAWPRAVAAMPRVLHAANTRLVQYDGAGSHYIGLMTLENAETPDTREHGDEREIGSAITACLLVDRERLSRAASCDPPFDDAFGIYLEDHDFALRARLAGFSILSVPRAGCLHGEGTKGLSLRRSGRYAEERVASLMRNRRRIVLKNYAARTLIALAPALGLFEVVQLAGAVKKGWLGPWARAARDSIGALPSILRERRRVQAARRVSDRELLAAGPLPVSPQLLSGGMERAGGRLLDALLGAYWELGRRLL